jgi:hypothetical protein
MYNSTRSEVVSVKRPDREGDWWLSRPKAVSRPNGENLHREATLKSPGIIDEESPFSKLITDY